MDILKDFIQHQYNSVYSITHVEWWLLKYSKKYQSINTFIQSQHLTEIDNVLVRLPPLGKSNADKAFLDLYQALDEVSKFHKYEQYFEQQVLDFHKIRNSKLEINQWLKKNETLGSDRFVCFFIDYLDYDKNDNEEHLSIYVNSLNEYDIFVDCADFKSTIKFLEIFNEHYWVNDNLLSD